MTVGARLFYGLMKAIFATCFRVFFRLRVEGREHEPRSGPVLAICNHVSAIDPPIAGVALRRRVRFMAKEELLRVPVLGALLRALGVFPVRRGEPDRQSIRTALEALAGGDLLLMFPEGTRSADGRLRAAEPGAALLALRTGAAVLPMAVIGTHWVMPKGARIPRPRPVVVRLGPPIPVPGQEGRLDRTVLEAWGQRFMAAIAALLPPEQQPQPSGQDDASVSGQEPER